ncbi:hypothetical protein Leryth_021433 [Lithospermum erythrorhizon]|nr:hypothetical protein Leryth_021433 [Lithospermum erythrorhizon]
MKELKLQLKEYGEQDLSESVHQLMILMEGLELFQKALDKFQISSRRSSYKVCETSHPDQKRSNHLIRSSWLMLFFRPELDESCLLRQGHQEFIDVSRLRDAGPWRNIKGHIRAVEFCRISSLEYSTISGSGESGCKLILEFIDPTSEVLGKLFKLTLLELADFPDFIVLKSRYDASIERNWTTRDKCQVWWKNDGEEAGSWWEGRIVGVVAKSPDFPDSPWERYSVSYRTAPKEIHQHSPWELYDASNMHWEPPHVDDEIRDKLLSMLVRLERSGNKAQDHYGIGKLKEVSEKISFINRYPVPLSLDVIQTRLENNYYRSLEAVKHDIDVLVSNAQSHFSKNAEYSKKTKRLSDRCNFVDVVGTCSIYLVGYDSRSQVYTVDIERSDFGLSCPEMRSRN